MKKPVSSLIVLAFITLLFIGPPNMTAEANTSDWELTFEDNFEGDTLDTDIWSYDIGNGFFEPDGTFVPGWGNQELQSYQEDNVRVEDGQLIIEAKDQEVTDETGTYNYTSGKIHTKGNFSQTYGRFEARMSLPAGQGFWPAFWMMPEDDVYGAWAASGEIDIMENAGATPNKVGGAIHYGSQWPNNTYTAGDYHFEDGFDTTDMNTYAVEWEPGEIRWYVNDTLYQTLNNWNGKDSDEATKFSYPAPFDQDFYMILNLAVGGWYGGAPDAETVFPNQVKVDYVRAYEKASYDAPTEPSFEAEELPADAKTAVDGNYVYDTDYAEGFTTLQTNGDVANNWDPTYWNFLKLDEFGGDGSVSTEAVADDTFAKVDITNGGSQTYALQLIQNVTVGKGRHYKLSFDAKADANRPMNVKIGGGAERGWTAYSPSEDYNLTTDVQTYDMVFQMQHDTDPLARLEFNVGNNTQGVSIGNVVLEEIDPVDPYNESDPKEPLSNGNYIYNGTFDQGAMDRLTYWDVAASAAEANTYVSESTRVFTAEITDGGDSADALTLAQPGLSFTPTDEYQLTFNAKAASARNIEVGFVNADGDVYVKETVTLTDAFENKTITLTMTDVEDLNGQLVFFLGGSDADVMLDDVELIRLTNNNTSLTLEESFPLRNGRFNQGLEYFGVHNQGDHEPTSVATLGVEAGAFVADIENTGWEPWHLMLMQNALTLKAGETYTVSFDASSTVERQVDVVVENAGYHRYFSDIVTLTEEMQTFEYTFDMTDDDTVDFKFLLGAIDEVADLPAHQVTIDNIGLEVAGSSEAAFLLDNADFSQEFEGWITHFQGQYDGPSQAEFSVEDEMAKMSIDHVGENPWDISLSQEGKSVTADQTYIVSFDAYATTARDIEAVIDNGEAGGYVRSLSEIVSLTEEVQNYNYEVTMSQDDIVGLKFLVGALEGAPSDAHDIFIDNVRFELAGVRDYLYGTEVITPDEEENTDTPDEGEESNNNSDVNGDTFVANDKAIEALQNNQAFKVEITDEKVTKVMISKKQLDMLKDKGAAVEVKKAGIQMTMPTSNLNGDVTFNVAPSSEEGLTNQSDALSDIYSFNVSENGVAKTTFDTPVTLRFKVKDADVDTSTLKVYYFNPETKMWELIGGEYVDGEVVADVDHFSTYAVFSTDTFAVADTPEDSESGVDTPTDESTEETNDEPTVTEEETNTDGEAVSDSDTSETDDSGDRLPETATNLYLLMLVGMMMLLMGGTTLIFKERRVRH
ncbi:MAG: carbohydrate binding domain-containing protein [Bacillota bacterium]